MRAKDFTSDQEADYGDEYQAMVQRVGQKAKQGPRKTVWDPDKRVYKTVPVQTDQKTATKISNR